MDSDHGRGRCSIQVAADMGIWIKAIQVILSKNTYTTDPRMNRMERYQGPLHTAMRFLASPGFLFGSACRVTQQVTEPKLLILVSFFSGEVTSYTDTSYCIHIMLEVCRSIFYGPPCISELLGVAYLQIEMCIASCSLEKGSYC